MAKKVESKKKTPAYYEDDDNLENEIDRQVSIEEKYAVNQEKNAIDKNSRFKKFLNQKEVEMEAKTEDEKFKCNQCDKFCKNNHGLKEHLKTHKN